MAGGNEREEGETDAVVSEDWEGREMSLLRRRRCDRRQQTSADLRVGWQGWNGLLALRLHTHDKSSLSLSRAVDAASASLVLYSSTNLPFRPNHPTLPSTKLNKPES